MFWPSSSVCGQALLCSKTTRTACSEWSVAISAVFCSNAQHSLPHLQSGSRQGECPICPRTPCTSLSMLTKSAWISSCRGIQCDASALTAAQGRLARWIKWRACDVGEAKEGLESSFSNLSITSPTSHLILQPFCRSTCITAQSPTLPLLHLHCRLFTYVTWQAANVFHN